VNQLGYQDFFQKKNPIFKGNNSHKNNNNQLLTNFHNLDKFIPNEFYQVKRGFTTNSMVIGPIVVHKK
jgi:hypothetical protein